MKIVKSYIFVKYHSHKFSYLQQVNDYVKNYIGEGKGPKNFAKEYLERRSKYKNSLKVNNQNFEDELLTPAQAINPNREPESNDGWINAGNSGGGGGAGKQSFSFTSNIQMILHNKSSH